MQEVGIGYFGLMENTLLMDFLLVTFL